MPWRGSVAHLHDNLAAGTGVSGPAARRAIHAAAQAPTFAGSLRTHRQAREILDNPALTICDNPRPFLMCVYNRDRALCHRLDIADAPSLDRCRPSCSNIARTDWHADELLQHAQALEKQAASEAVPGPLADRLTQRAGRLRDQADRPNVTAFPPPGADVMRPAPDERDRIRAAMDRIFDGTPERSNGALTIVALALALAIRRASRNALTQRHTDLKKEFYDKVRAPGGYTGERPPTSPTSPWSATKTPGHSSLQPRSASGQADWVTSEEMPANSSRPLAVRVREDQAALWEGTESDALFTVDPQAPASQTRGIKYRIDDSYLEP
ncbi:hypothetical protein [Streptomyces sp. V1I1]|uniref:hypothetical protein n=1 Tax=Streptomyces sp. V1I1 TaxID=3042272 RepID=UPI0027D76C35|nr:hypothetical protein [Streptomyces sp. V1I1]